MTIGHEAPHPDISEKQSVIDRVRSKRVKLAWVLKNHTGIRRIVEGLYPDSAHFIFELLQNAEDTGSTEVDFVLTNDGLSFEHNGRPFTELDILGITNVGEGTKSDDVDTIGRFGVGFKAVFDYTESPLIWSPTYSFQIDELVLPSLLNDRSNLNGKTRFEFPFNNAKKPREVAFKEVEDGLRDLAESTLLFLNHLQLISWKIGDSEAGAVLRTAHSENHIEVLKETNGAKTASSHYLRFTRPVEGLAKQTQHKVAVAFALEFLPDFKSFDLNLPIAKQMRISPVQGEVAVFFPAEKETSGLRFHLHAPFVPDMSRASIKDTPTNKPLFEQLAGLAAISLHEIRDFGLLMADFLAVLPNKQEFIPARYEAIRKSIIHAMNSEALTPTHDKLHAPAGFLLQAKASLKSLLSEKDIEYLVNYDDEAPRWAVGATQKNNNIDRFLASLAIRDWGLDEFVELLTDRSSAGTRYVSHAPYCVQGPNSEFMDWLASKPIEWHQQLYALLFSELAPKGELYRLKGCQIARLFDGNYSVGSECYFPDDGDQDDSVLPRIAVEAYSTGRTMTQQDNSRKFLEDIGVRIVGEAEQVELILQQRYTREADRPDKKIYLKDLKRFMSLVEKEATQSSLFRDSYIFECAGNQWCMPSQVYLDEPFADTGLSAYYEVQKVDAQLHSLSEFYREVGFSAKKISAFAKAVGVKAELSVISRVCQNNPEWAYLRQVGGKRKTRFTVNRDYDIPALEDLLTKPSLMLSKLVWRTMSSLPNDGRHLVAIFQRNASAGVHKAASALVHVLRNAAWVPQGSGSFVRTAEASRDLLPDGFPFDPGQRWLKAVKWGEEIIKRTEQQREKETSAKELGFSDLLSLERARRFAALPLEDQERFLTNLERKTDLELPDRSPSNPDRRAARVGEMAADAPERRTEERTRSVSVGREAVKAEAAQYLEQQYSVEGELICQVCKTQMPFKLDDGSSYFEKVEFLPDLSRRHHQNYIGLCPNHAAMFKFANGSKDLMLEMFSEIRGNELEVVLAQKDATVYFTKTHIADLIKIIEVERNKDSILDDDGLDSQSPVLDLS